MPLRKARLSGLAGGGDDQKIDLRLSDLVDVIGPSIQRDVQDDLNKLSIAVARALERPDVCFINMAAQARHLRGEAHGGVGPGIIGGAIAMAVISASSSLVKFLPR